LHARRNVGLGSGTLRERTDLLEPFVTEELRCGHRADATAVSTGRDCITLGRRYHPPVPRRVIVLLIVAAIAAPVVFSTGARAALGTDLEWKECGRGFECGTLDVPVDYSRPQGPTVGLAVTRLRAAEPSTRRGVLFVNFGGPGVPSAELLREAVLSLPPFLHDRFDLVSFDPRGTGSSRVVDCLDDATFRRYLAEDPTPDGVDDLRRYYDGSAFSVDLVGGCIARQGDWLAHVGTRNVARDVDRLRLALGEQKINFLGYSYGTVLGAAYAQEFPHGFRTMVLDSAVNLSDTRQRELEQNAKGFEHALDEFLDTCAADPDCTFTAGADPRSELLHLRDEFEGGTTISAGNGEKVGVSEFYVALLAALYSPSYWRDLAVALQSAANGKGAGLRRLTDAYVGTRADGTYNNLQEAIGVIVCDDVPEPKVTFDEFRAAYDDLSARYPFFGPVLGGAPIGCDARLPAPSSAEILGDVRTDEAAPVLVIGVTNDPATPYLGAKDLVSRLDGSRLLTLEGTQHGGFGQGSACVDDAVERYFLQRRLPARKTRCAA
jgi:pimeloyl-ACP methyl ester carboxylesterase